MRSRSFNEMRLLRLQLLAPVLVIGMSAVSTLSAPAAAAKKKPTATKSSKTRESSQSKSAKSKKVQPQAKNSRARRTQSPTASPQLASQSRSSSQAADVTSTRKGKKGFAVSKAATPETPASRTTTTTTTLNAPKTTAVVAPITAPAVNQRSASSSLLLKSETSAPVQPASEPVQSSAPPTAPVATNQPDRLEVIEYRDAQKNSAGPRSPPPSQSRGFGISNRRIEVEIDTPRVIQIQKALKDRGFYTLDPTGIYDEDTINAMRAFQESERIDITGYPTAHALKRLGL